MSETQSNACVTTMTAELVYKPRLYLTWKKNLEDKEFMYPIAAHPGISIIRVLDVKNSVSRIKLLRVPVHNMHGNVILDHDVVISAVSGIG